MKLALFVVILMAAVSLNKADECLEKCSAEEKKPYWVCIEGKEKPIRANRCYLKCKKNDKAKECPKGDFGECMNGCTDAENIEGEEMCEKSDPKLRSKIVCILKCLIKVFAKKEPEIYPCKK